MRLYSRHLLAGSTSPAAVALTTITMMTMMIVSSSWPQKSHMADAFVMIPQPSSPSPSSRISSIVSTSATIFMTSTDTETTAESSPCSVPDADTPSAVTAADLRSASLVNHKNERVLLGDILKDDDETTSIVVFLRHMG